MPYSSPLPSHLCPPPSLFFLAFAIGNFTISISLSHIHTPFFIHKFYFFNLSHENPLTLFSLSLFVLCDLSVISLCSLPSLLSFLIYVTVFKLSHSIQIFLLYAGLLPVLLSAPPLPWKVFGFHIPNIFAISAPFSSDAEYFILIHYLSKILDFCDTVFILLRKKTAQFSFLHVYHHATIITIWGYLLNTGYGGGAVSFGAFLNSLVHVLMYSHYLLSTFNIHNPFKLILTQIQIAQFYLCVSQALLVACTNAEKLFPTSLALLQLGYHTTMVLLFSDFLKKSKKSMSDKSL